MKILYITSSTTPYGGASKAFMQMLFGLASIGIDPLVILPNNDGLYQILKSKGIKCIALTNYRPSVYPWLNSAKDKLLFIPRLLGRLLVNNIATMQLIKIVQQFKPDIIHSNVSVIAIGYYVARFFKIPHIWHIREYGDKDFNLHYYPCRDIQSKRYKTSKSYTICITKDIQKYNNLQNCNNSLVIYDGVLLEKYITFNYVKSSYFLFAGRLEPAKGVLPLIDAYAEYCTQHTNPLPLYIAGSGTESYTQLIKHKIQEYDIENKIKLLGMRNDILNLYKDATALIVSSLSEGFGFITAEAMFFGCLVIGNNIAGTKEQFDNGKELMGDEIALRYTTEHYEPMIIRSQETVKKLYSTEQHIQQVYNFYNEIMHQQ